MLRNTEGLITLTVMLLLMVGCGPIMSRSRIAVEFEDSVSDLKNGDQVYLLGVPVGEVEDPLIVNTRPVVPVVLRDGGVFGTDKQVFFYMAADPAVSGRQSLVAIIHSLPAEKDRPRFRGFSSKTKLMLQMGAEKAESWWNSLGSSK